ncbi:BQ2448_5631 [Microbotryum intermedium]|uniref:BQ2448_5631 protein n=1 Tax=Microbotryum intermedium TaxID=269621 RepID=A0A238F1U2_9BASI|nr:BQ2448_5631 [Microbotryum intermedium]
MKAFANFPVDGRPQNQHRRPWIWIWWAYFCHPPPKYAARGELSALVVHAARFLSGTYGYFLCMTAVGEEDFIGGANQSTWSNGLIRPAYYWSSRLAPPCSWSAPLLESPTSPYRSDSACTSGPPPRFRRCLHYQPLVTGTRSVRSSDSACTPVDLWGSIKTPAGLHCGFEGVFINRS